MKDILKKILIFIALDILVFTPCFWLVGQFWGGVNVEHLADSELPPGSSAILDANARILERELKTGWAPSAKFSPILVRTDMDAYQRGLLDVLTRSLQEMNSRLFRVGSENNADANLKNALNDINRPADTWSIFSANSTVDRLQSAVKRLDAFNANLLKNGTPIEKRIDVVSAEINDFIGLLSDEHTALDAVADNGNMVWGARAPFYHAQGVLIGICLELTAARKDFYQVLEFQSALVPFDRAVKTSCDTIGVRPLPVFNGSGYGWFGGNVRNLSGHIGTTLYDLNALQQALAGASSPLPKK